MALDREQVGLIFKLEADSKAAKSEMVAFKAFVDGIVEGIQSESKQAIEGLNNKIVDLERKLASATERRRRDSKATNSIVRESIETLSSEIIESFGIDGDIANSIAAMLVKLRGSAALAAGVIGGLAVAIGAAAVGLVAFTLKTAAAAREIELSSQILGLNTEKLQLYQIAAEQAGTSTDAITGLFKEFKEQTGQNASAFDAFLRSLESVKSPAEKLAIIQANLGKVSDDSARAILALTENQGEMRKEIERSGLILSDFEARQLAQTNRQFEALKIQVEGFAKRSLLSLTGNVQDSTKALSEGRIVAGLFGETIAGWVGAQQQAAAAIRDTTGAIEGQANAVNALAIALQNANFQAVQTGIKERINKIVKEVSSAAPRALTAAEVKAVVERQKKLDPAFAEGLRSDQIFRQNQKSFDDFLNPKKPTGRRSAGRHQATNDALALLKVQEQAAQRTAQAEIEAARQAFAERKIAVEQLVQLTIDAESKMLAAKRAVFAEERREIGQSKFRKGEKEVKLAQVTEREAAAEAAATKAIDAAKREELKVVADANKILEKAEEDHARRLEQIEKASAAARIAAIRAAVDVRTLTEEQGAIEIAHIQLAAAAAEEDRLKERLDKARAAVAAAEAAIQTGGPTATNTKAQAEAKAAEQEALDRLKIFQDERTRIEVEGNRELEEGRQKDNENLRRYVEEQIRLSQGLVRARADQLVAGFGQDGAQAIAIQENLLGRQLTLLEQLGVAAQAYANTLRNDLSDAMDRALNVTGVFNEAFGSAIDAFVSSGGSIKAAAKALAIGLASPYIEAAKAAAKYYAALSIASFAALDFRGGILYGLAAVGFAALGAIGTALVNGSGAGGRASIPGAVSGSDNRQSNEKRIIEQGDRRRQEPIIIQIRTEDTMVVERLSRDYNGNGATRRMLRADILGESAA